MKIYLILPLLLSITLSEEYSIVSGGVDRTFNAYFPLDTTGQIPMVIIMHGLGGSSADMEGLIDYFIDSGAVPVFPQAYFYENLPEIGSTTVWNFGALPELYSDVQFIADLIDHMALNHSFIDTNRVYATGYSAGGFMSYRLACDLADKITAVASVGGNFYKIDDGTDCLDQNREIPIMHIHGNYDPVVTYYMGGPSVFGQDVPYDETLTISESIDFWTEYNDLTIETTDTLMSGGWNWWYTMWLPSNSIKFTYSSENSNTQFIHILAEGGGHLWFLEAWGWGFDSHVEIYNFFMQYQLSDFFYIAPPENFTINAEETYVVLDWDPVSSDDFQYYLLERSTDSEFSTNLIANYLPTNQYEDHDIEYDTEYFYRVSYNEGGEWSEHSEVISITLEWMDISRPKALPIHFRLHQNYPNPFNPETYITYDLPEDGFVSVDIYDMRGVLIKTLVNDVQPRGYRTIKWNGTNDNGQKVSAGLYLYRIEAMNFTDTKKMMLLN